MFGDNNAGKTASLSGIKLLLYPEVSFLNSDKKFNFKGKDSTYSKEESFNFYFPSSISYIALEVENPEGIFCMVLYKATEYGYGRFFVPESYSSIEPIFWDRESNNFPSDLGLKTVSKQLKQREAIQTKDKKEIANLIYASYGDSKEKSRFCTIPLKDRDSPDAIKAFKEIFQLAFDGSGASKETLPSAIATLIEMNHSRKNEKLEANLNELTFAHDRLYEQGKKLDKLNNAKNTWLNLLRKYEESEESLFKYSTRFNEVNNYCIKKLETYDIKNEQEFVFRNVKKTSDHLKMILKKGNYVQENI